MNTIKALCNGDMTKREEILQTDYNTVFVWLEMSKEEAIYRRKYYNVLKSKKE